MSQKLTKQHNSDIISTIFFGGLNVMVRNDNMTSKNIDLKLTSLGNHYRDTGMVVIGANESLGVPCAIRSKNRQGFSELFVKAFRTLGIDVTYINAYSMKINKSWHIDRLLKHNLSVAEIKKIQELSIDYARKGPIEKIGMSKNLKEMYSIQDEDFNIRIADELQNAEQPLFFYSCGANNIMHKLHASPISAIINNETRAHALRRIDEEKALLTIMKDIAQNFENIYSLNSKTDIFCLGIYIPLAFQRFMAILPKLGKFNDIINEYNYELQKLCTIYNVAFVDNSYLTKYCGMMGLDFHAVQEGHNLMAQNMINEVYNKVILNKRVNSLPSPISQFEIDNKGLPGMVEDANADYLKAISMLSHTGTENEYFNEWSSKATEYRREYDLFTDANLQIVQKKLIK